MERRLALIVLYVFCSSAAWAEDIKVPNSKDGNAQYVLGLLDLALQKQTQAYQLKPVDGDFFVSVPRLVESAETGQIDLIWTATNQTVEQQLIPVRIPLYMGLFGYRVLIVNKSHSNMFNPVKDIEALKKFKFGQGRGWSDTDILIANGLNVVQATKWDGLFHMTDGQRFDAFPRGIHEPWNELGLFADLELAVDDNILLIYPMPFYLFVNPKRKELARNIELGLESAIADGSFRDYFMKSETLKQVIAFSQFNKRQKIYLQNPKLPTETPIDRPELWLESLDIFN